MHQLYLTHYYLLRLRVKMHRQEGPLKKIKKINYTALLGASATDLSKLPHCLALIFN